MRKRKTLPDNFQEIVDSGDMDAFKAVFQKCEISAKVSRGSSCNALSCRGLTPLHIQFLVDQGIDINDDCGFGMPAAAFQAYRMENLKCLLDNGADINLALKKYKGNALYHAALGHNVPAIRNLLECGAAVQDSFGLDGKTALEELLAGCMNVDIVNTLEAAKLLLDAGAVKSSRMKDYVHKIGERFEFYRADFNKDSVDEFSGALAELYRLFDVEPVPQRILHDGKSTIIVKEKTWQKQHQELWDMLVPGRGAADTVQGELIRIVGKILYEILDNGGMNWDAEYKKLARAMINYFKMADGMEPELMEEACGLADKVSANSDEKLLYRLNELTVKWVLANPEPIKLQQVDYKR